MAENRAKLTLADGSPVTWCMFCGATVGQTSDRTGAEVTGVFYCPKCCKTYCDQCSYSEEAGGSRVQLCLRCDSQMEAVT